MDQRVAPVGDGLRLLRRLDRVEHDVDAGVAGDVRDHLPAGRWPMAIAAAICSGVSVRKPR